MENCWGDEMESNVTNQSFNQQNNQPFTYNFENLQSNQLQYQTQPMMSHIQNFNSLNVGDFSHIPKTSINNLDLDNFFRSDIGSQNAPILENNSSQFSPISISDPPAQNPQSGLILEMLQKQNSQMDDLKSKLEILTIKIGAYERRHSSICSLYNPIIVLYIINLFIYNKQTI